MKSKSYFRLPREIPNLFNINFKFKWFINPTVEMLICDMNSIQKIN